MTEIEFDFNQKNVVIQANLRDSFQEVIKKYFQKAEIDPRQFISLPMVSK